MQRESRTPGTSSGIKLRYYWACSKKIEIELAAYAKCQDILVSYVYVRRENIDPGEYRDRFRSIILDSGGYTFRKAEEVADGFDAYADYSKRVLDDDKVDFLFAYDAGTAEESFQYYQDLRANIGPEFGNRLIPIYRMGDDVRWFHRYAEVSGYVGVAGLASNDSGRWERLANLARLCLSEPHVTVHGLGVGDAKPIRYANVPWGSVDSSKWARVSSFYKRQQWVGELAEPWRLGYSGRDMGWSPSNRVHLSGGVPKTERRRASGDIGNTPADRRKLLAINNIRDDLKRNGINLD